MKIIRKAGDTSNILQIFIQDSSSTTGAGLTSLVFNSSGLTAYYHKDTDTTATAISLVTMTVGTFTSSGFKEIDSTNMPGWYQFCPPDAALSTSGSPKSVGFHLKGATNMAPLAIEVQLVAIDVQDTVRFGLTALPNVASGSAGAIITSGTGTAQLSVSSGFVTVTTNNDKTGYSLTQSFPSNFAALSITAGGTVNADAKAINGVTLAAQALSQSTESICWGTCSGGTTTTAIVSTLNNPSSLTDSGQLIGRTIIFLGNTGTANMQAQASNITNSSTGATPTITFTAMTHAPANGDVFVII
jgi:hypothetical protein